MNEDEKEFGALSDEELKAEKERLLKLLQESGQGEGQGCVEKKTVVKRVGAVKASESAKTVAKKPRPKPRKKVKRKVN